MNSNQTTEQLQQAAPVPTPQEQAPQAQSSQPSRALSPQAVAALVIGAFLASLTVFGLCAGVIYISRPHVEDALERARVPVPAMRPNANDWWTQRVLSEVYTSALDTVVVDQAVQEKLGEPVETDVTAAELFVRVNDGELDNREEAIVFDVLGPMGRGTVRVTTSGTGNTMGRATPIEIKTIAVTLEDGTVIDVEPPAKRDVQIR